MWTSILHRATGIALYGGALILAAWAICLAAGPGPYEQAMAVLGSPLGVLAMIGLTWSLMYHLANGVRHLLWDVGVGLAVPTADATGWFVIVFSFAATAAVWAAAVLMGLL